jgi:hypothetical protein
MIAHRRWKINFGKRTVWWRIGLGFGSGFTDISVAPSAIYNFNEYVAFGAGLQYKYLKQRDFCVSFVWRKRNCTLNPINEIQLSAELEQLRVNVNGDGSNTILKIIGIQDYLWEQVTALATPLLVRVTMC